MRVVVVGNGVAGMEAALAIRGRESGWDITLVSEESDHFFSRTALMWVHAGQMSHRDIEPLERDVYERMGFNRVRARATGVDLGSRTLTLSGGQDPIPFDQLLIACGSRPRPGPWPGADLRGIGHFVTLQDLEWFEQEVHGRSDLPRPPRPDHHLAASEDGSPYKPRKSASQHRGAPCKLPCVVGGGLIGIEAIEVMLTAKLRPRFFIREDWFWPMAIDAKESEWIMERMTEHGVQMHLQHNVETFTGDADGNVQKVKTDQGEFETDCVVISIGVVPNTDWLVNSGIELHERGGVLVDRELRTNVDGIYAAGDCAVVHWYDGSRRPQQLWYTSRDQGRVAAGNILGDGAEYARGIWYNSAKLMDIEYTTVGLVNMKVDGEQSCFFEETGPVRSTTRIVSKGARVIGFNMLGRRWDHSILVRWIAERRPISWVLEHINAARFDTEFVPPLRVPASAKTSLPEVAAGFLTGGP